jgi:hypothetical protein
VQSQIEFGRTNFRFAECSMSIGLQALLGGENPSNAGGVFLSGTGAFFAAARLRAQLGTSSRASARWQWL